jgi:hypothetical protein
MIAQPQPEKSGGSMMPPEQENIFPIKPIHSASRDSQQAYSVSYGAFTFTPFLGVNIAIKPIRIFSQS